MAGSLDGGGAGPSGGNKLLLVWRSPYRLLAQVALRGQAGIFGLRLEGAQAGHNGRRVPVLLRPCCAAELKPPTEVTVNALLVPQAVQDRRVDLIQSEARECLLDLFGRAGAVDVFVKDSLDPDAAAS